MKKLNSNDSEGLMSTLIGQDTVFTGTVDVKGAIRVDGTVKGKVICTETITVGSSGVVEAEIESRTAIIAGKMHGNVNASEKVELQANCEMDGDLKTKSLVIEEGAVFCGACNMKGATPDMGFLPPVETMKEAKPKMTPEKVEKD